MQQLWLDDVKWDDQLKPLSLLKWKAFLKDYSDINTINIPRWVQYSPECEIEFHGYCDSSELAYAAVLYARVKVGNIFYSNILVSKTKVAPIKKISLPRLELCGALWLADVIRAFLPQISVRNYTLAWLKNPSQKYKRKQEIIGCMFQHMTTPQILQPGG